MVVVGDERPTSRDVTWVREEPAYGGPVAATYAGRDALGSVTGRDSLPDLVLAVDMPDVTAETVRRLLDGAAGHDGAVLVDGGRRHLAFAVSPTALDRVRPVPTTGAAMRDLWSRARPGRGPGAGRRGPRRRPVVGPVADT